MGLDVVNDIRFHILAFMVRALAKGMLGKLSFSELLPAGGLVPFVGLFHYCPSLRYTWPSALIFPVFKSRSNTSSGTYALRSV